MGTVFDFLSRRKALTTEYFACPGGSRRTVLLSSHIWWTELIAYSLLRLGYNVLVAEAWYLLWTEDQRWPHFDSLYQQWIDIIKRFDVQLAIGANTTIMVPHPRRGELLHRAAGVPAVHLWWDEPRAIPPMARRGVGLDVYLSAMKDDRTLNVFWDIDVLEEMARYFGVTNSIHSPLAATPEFWQGPNTPLASRRMKLCFLGNNHDEGKWRDGLDPGLLNWAEQVVALKLANLDRPMVDCIDAIPAPSAPAGAAPGYVVAASLSDEFHRWNILGAVLLTQLRNRAVLAAARHLGNDFTLIGTGWDRMGLAAKQQHSGADAREFYAQSQASLNLFGGCVHGGMPLRPYEIAAAKGLLFTQYNRELPALFEPERECVAFRNAEEMLPMLDRVLHHPSEFDTVVAAGRRRAVAEHTWERRLERILSTARERFDLPW